MSDNWNSPHEHVQLSECRQFSNRRRNRPSQLEVVHDPANRASSDRPHSARDNAQSCDIASRTTQARANTIRRHIESWARVVASYPHTKTKVKERHDLINMRRTESIVNTHERGVLCSLQRLRQNTMRPANDQQPKGIHSWFVWTLLNE